MIEYVRHPRLAERYGDVQDPEGVDLEEDRRETGSVYFSELIEKIDTHRLYRTREAAAILECSTRYVQLLVKRGRLRALKSDCYLCIPGHSLIHFIDKSRTDIR